MSSLAKLGNFLNSPPGLLAVLAVLIGFLVSGAFAARKLVQKHYQGQFVVILGLIYLSLVFLIISYSFRKSGPVNAAVMPRLWIFGILACCLYLLISIFRGKESPDPEEGSFGKPILYILMCLAYIVLMPYLGFFIASLIFLIFGILVLNYRRWGVIISVSVGWLAFNYFLFYKLLFVPFPEGTLLRILHG